MRVYLIRFCDPSMTFESLRIAAPNRISAILQAQAVCPEAELVASADQPVADGVLCAIFGEAPVEEPDILSAVPRSGLYAGKHISRHEDGKWYP